MFVFFDDESKSAEAKPTAPGHVQFDARGNAVYAWGDNRLAQDGAKADELRQMALRSTELKLVDDAPAVTAAKSWNDKGLQTGYNPYQSGLLAGKKPAAKRTDIRELSKWIEMKRRMDGHAPTAKKSAQSR